MSETQEMDIQRRAYLNKNTEAELAIRDAIRAVEAAGADVRLTDAVVLLGAALDSTADYVDGIERRRWFDVCDGMDIRSESSRP